MEIKPYYLKRRAPDGVFPLYHYLYIKGGSGHGKKDYGGTYSFVGYYATLEEEEEIRKSSPEKSCDHMAIPFVHGETIEEVLNQLESFSNK